MKTSFLASLKPGEKVGVSSASGRYGSLYSIETVDRVTKTQIVVGYRKFRKADGYQIGREIYHPRHLVEAEKAEACNTEIEARKAYARIKSEVANSLNLLTEDEVRSLHETITSRKEQAELEREKEESELS